MHQRMDVKAIQGFFNYFDATLREGSMPCVDTMTGYDILNGDRGVAQLG